MDPRIYFPLPIKGEVLDNGRRFRLIRPFVYHDPELQLRVLLPKGFSSDFNSVPEPLWAYFAPWEYPEAGLVHDWLYRAPDCLESGIWALPLTRQQADEVHRRLLHIKGCRLTKRNVVYYALRSFGGKVWNNYRRHDSGDPSH